MGVTPRKIDVTPNLYNPQNILLILKCMNLFEEFKRFILRGNILDLAIAVIIGTAFGKVTSSLVNDILMPPIGLMLGQVDFKYLKFVLKETSSAGEAVTINYGMFTQTIVDFMIIAFTVFIVFKVYKKLQREENEEPDPSHEQTKEEILLTEIRDLLKENKS